MAPHRDFENILNNIEGLCRDYQRLNMPHQTYSDRREELVSKAFEQIRHVTDIKEASQMGDQLVGIMRG